WMNSSSPIETKTPSPRQIPRQVDSGYATQTNTAFNSPVSKRRDSTTSQASRDEFAHNSTSSVPMPGREDLQIVRRHIDYTSNTRFREIAPSMQQLLHKSLQKRSLGFPLVKAKPKRAQMTMSMRLMVVGTSAETAKPSIVIFLAGDQTRNLETALQGQELKKLYTSDDGVTPSFDVIVVGQEPKKRSQGEVCVTWDASRVKERHLPTLCGLQISFGIEDESSVTVSTIGGIVKLIYGPGDFKLVAMTAGHPLCDLLDTDPDDAINLEVTAFADPRALGTVLHPVVEEDRRDADRVLIPKHDWALVEIDTGVRIRPNLIPVPGSSGGLGIPNARSQSQFNLPSRSFTPMTAAPPASFPSVKPIEVALLTGSCSSRFSGARLGLLSHMPGAIMLSPENGFVDAYLLTLDDGQELQDGDSGSWVVNPVSLEVYGHVVATDITGDGYVIPLHASLDEMKQALGVEEVTLPGTADLLDVAL
ncbi:hypothetical protein B0T14DRAFT_388302, partial [Immersiella caudata]